MCIALLVLEVPLVEVDVEDDNCTRVQSAENESLVGGDRHGANRTVCLRKRVKVLQWEHASNRNPSGVRAEHNIVAVPRQSCA